MPSKNALGLSPLNVGILSPTQHNKSRPNQEVVLPSSPKRSELFSFQLSNVLKKRERRKAFRQ
jgi:hypothetical protein